MARTSPPPKQQRGLPARTVATGRPPAAALLVAALAAALLVAALAAAGAVPPALSAQIRSGATGDTASVIPGSHLAVYLMTMGPGDQIWERFSHNALVIRDESAGTEIAYNWGIFDFNQEDFIARLARGRMLYRMEGGPAAWLVEQYRRANRSVWTQRVNLTPAQRLELQASVLEMDTDANRNYRYDYYRDNCSTRVRDELDRVLGGQIRAATEGVETGTTYRWHTARLLQPALAAYAGIQFVVGHRGDEPISAWDEMFLPLPLKRHLEGVTVRTPEGEEVPLLGPAVQLVEARREPVPAEAPDFTLGFLALGVLVGSLFAFFGRLSAGGSRLGSWLLALSGTGWSLTLGVLGTALLLSWAFTDHVFWRVNENAMLANPLSLVLALLLIPAALGRGRRWAGRLASTVAALAAAGFVLQVLPGIDQTNGDILAVTLPAHVGLAWGVMRAWRPRPAIG